jgi:uncharacterized protein YecA (UPF0149 family)
LFDLIWKRYGDELVRRHDEVRAVVQSLALASTAPSRPLAPATIGRPSRNAPCPCGSGKKFKRCCALAGSASARSR